MQTPALTGFRPIQFSLLLACGIATGAHAQGFLTDQSLQPPPFTGGSYHYDSSIGSLVPATGQEFTPSLQGLDFVDVRLRGSAVGDTFQIAIHEGTITAPVLGLSDPAVSSGSFPMNEAHFTFSSTVPLVVGNLYVLEIIQGGGYSGWGIEIPVSAVVNGQPVDMNYPGGRLIYNGVQQDSRDLIFREGMIVPEPGVITLGLLGVLAFGSMWKRGYRQRNVGSTNRLHRTPR
jgi:hypothetical protein